MSLVSLVHNTRKCINLRNSIDCCVDLCYTYITEGKPTAATKAASEKPLFSVLMVYTGECDNSSIHHFTEKVNTRGNKL